MSRIKILLLTSFFTSSLFAGVNLKNGNFFVSYKDVVSTNKGISLELTRTYNSKSTSVGWFGYGWGTPFETKLEASVDGSVIIFENGSGGRARFTPSEKISSSNIQRVVSEIVKAVKTKSQLTGKAQKDLEEKLRTNSFYRHQLAKAHKVNRKLKDGTVLVSHDYGHQKLYVLDKGYKRVYDSGLTQFFSKKGYLISTKESSGYKLKLSRNKSTMLVDKIIDSVGNQMFLKWDSNKRLVKASTKGGLTASYKYSGKNLVESRDINGYNYAYSYDQYHNMTNILDKKVKSKRNASMTITYAPKTFFVTNVKKRSGEIVKYKYESKNSGLHYLTTVIKSGISDTPYANTYEYEHKRRTDGSLWLYRTKFVSGADYKKNKVIGGILRETINNECCEQPLKIIQGDQITNFKYKNGMLVEKKSNDGTIVKLEYNQIKKVSKITDKNQSISYKYNKKGELAKAVSNKGKAVLLVYDIGGRITKMVEQVGKKKNILSFGYNSIGKPTQISMNKVGKLLVKYDASGQVKSVDSKGGRNVASRVSSAFQNLLSMVKPAGVSLDL